MRKARAIIIEDDPEFRKQLHLLLFQFFRDTIIVVGEAMNVAEGKIAVEKYKPDIIFLDMELPDGVGYDVLDAFPDDVLHLRFLTLIISAYKQYRPRAFRYRVVNYLLKGFSNEEFIETIDHLLVVKNSQFQSEQSEQSGQIEQSDESEIPLRLPTPHNGILIVPPHEIGFCTTESNTSLVRLIDKSDREVDLPLKELELLLEPHKFIRIHRSFIVNERFILQGHSLTNRNKATIELSPLLLNAGDLDHLRIGETYLEAVSTLLLHRK
jgi:two-component system LytT family response regulator